MQLNLPLRNRVAESDAARDQIQVRQVRARTEKLSESIRQDIENAQIAVETSFAAYKAAVQSRGYQEELLQAERDKLEFGESTNLNVSPGCGLPRAGEVDRGGGTVKLREGSD